MTGDRLYLTHILDAIKKIETYISVGHDVFVSTSHWQDAVIRQLEIVGEATKRLSKQLCSQHPEVLWRRIAGARRADSRLYGRGYQSGVGDHAKGFASCKKEYPKNSPSNKKHLGGFAYVARMNGPDS